MTLRDRPHSTQPINANAHSHIESVMKPTTRAHCHLTTHPPTSDVVERRDTHGAPPARELAGFVCSKSTLGRAAMQVRNVSVGPPRLLLHRARVLLLLGMCRLNDCSLGCRRCGAAVCGLDGRATKFIVNNVKADHWMRATLCGTTQLSHMTSLLRRGLQMNKIIPL